MKPAALAACSLILAFLCTPAVGTESTVPLRPEPHDSTAISAERKDEIRNKFLQSCQRATEAPSWCACLYDGLPDPIRFWPFNAWLIYTGTMEQLRFAGQLKIGADSPEARLKIYQDARETVRACAASFDPTTSTP